MIRRLSLSQRLALVVVSLLILCAAAVCVVQLHSSAQYGNAMVQRLPPGWLSKLWPANRCWTPTARSTGKP